MTQTLFTPLTVAEMVEALTVPPIPFHITAFDGSTTGPEDADFRFHIRDVDTLAYIATAPGDLGLARAYMTGGLEVEGEHLAHPYRLFDSLQGLYECFRRPDAPTMITLVRSLRQLGALKIQPLPEVERTSWWHKRIIEGLSRHSRERDKESVSSHYDVSNDFYELFLGESMTYTCAYFPAPDSTLAEAQENQVPPDLREAAATGGGHAARRGVRLGRHDPLRRPAGRPGHRCDPLRGTI